MGRNYVKKKRSGTEQPELVKKMQISVKPRVRDGDPYYTDIIFKNSVEDIGFKNYVAYDVADDKIYFKFYKSRSYNESDNFKFKMFSSGSENIRTINVCRDFEMQTFWNKLWYPIYYLPSSDEYFIDIKDVKRRNLLTAEKSDDVIARDLYSVIHDAAYDAIKEALFR